MMYSNKVCTMKHIQTTFNSLIFGTFFLALFVLPFVVAMPAHAEMCGDVTIAVGVDCGGESNPIYGYAKGIMRFLSVAVGIVVVGAIIVGGIAYASARDDKAQLAKAIDIIRNAIIGLLLFIGMGAILNTLIPGGIL